MPEGLGDQVQFQDGDIANAAFDPGHVGSIDAGGIGQHLLRPATLLAEFAHTPAQRAKERLWARGRRFRHPAMLLACGLSVHGL